MSDDPNDKIGREVTGIVTAYWPSEGKRPHGFYVRGDDQKYTTFDDATADPIEEGIEIAFRAEKNDPHWNIKEGTVSVIDSDPDMGDEHNGGKGSIRNSECVHKNGEDVRMFSMNDARIMSQSIVRSAVLFHQGRDESTVEDVEETAHQLAELEPVLVRQLRGVPLEGEA